MIGYTAEEMLVLRVEDVHPEASLPHVLALFEKLMSGEITVASDLPVQRKDGKVFYADVHSVPIVIHGRHLFLGIFRDITERKLAEDMLLESEQRHRAYIQNAPYGVFVTDEHGRYQQVNPAACQLTGYTEPEILPMSIADLLAEESLEQGLRHFQQAVQEGRSHGELRYRTKSGEHRWWSINAIKISDTRILGFCEDITERKLAEDLLQQQTAALRASNVELEIFNRAAVGRELRMIDLKEQINELCRRLGEPPRYGTQ
jgi:PAS domain S-box-containing protein